MQIARYEKQAMVGEIPISVILLPQSGSFMEMTMATAWMEMLKDGNFDKVFPAEDVTLSDMFTWASHNDIYIAFHGNNGDFAGMGWAINKQQIGDEAYKAEVGMVFRPQFHGKPEIYELASMMIDHGFEHSKLDMVYGVIPTENKLACRFARQIGFDYMGTIPAYSPKRIGEKLVPVRCDQFYVEKWKWETIRKKVNQEELVHGSR